MLHDIPLSTFHLCLSTKLRLEYAPHLPSAKNLLVRHTWGDCDWYFLSRTSFDTLCIPNLLTNLSSPSPSPHPFFYVQLIPPSLFPLILLFSLFVLFVVSRERHKSLEWAYQDRGDATVLQHSGCRKEHNERVGNQMRAAYGDENLILGIRKSTAKEW